MNFFEHQLQAKKKSRILLFVFFLAVFFVSVVIAFILTEVYDRYIMEHHFYYEYEEGTTEIAKVFYYVVDTFYYPPFLIFLGGIASIIFLTSYFKTRAFSKAGEKIAKLLGGELIEPSETNFLKQRYRNVVEEMAIASGVQIPKILVLPDEHGINAFAAGLKPNKSAICVTQGALEKLDRDELQAVVGHEMSHVLNGDMALNVKLYGYISGLVMLSDIGWFLVRAVFESRKTPRTYRSSSNKKDKGGGGIAIILAVGLTLWICGWMGKIAGSLIKSLISKQRELLADASSVQFTRNPEAMAWVLRKIKFSLPHGHLTSPMAGSMSYFFLSSPQANRFFSFPSHPPIEDRLLAISPRYHPEAIEDLADETEERLKTTQKNNQVLVQPISTPNTSADKTPPKKMLFATATAIAVGRNDLVNNVGTLTNEAIANAKAIMQALPQSLLHQCHTVTGATETILAIMLSGKSNITPNEKLVATKHFTKEISKTLPTIANQIEIIDDTLYVPILKICIATLNQTNNEKFVEQLIKFARSDKALKQEEMLTLFYCVSALPISQRLKRKLGRINTQAAYSAMIKYAMRIAETADERLFEKISEEYFDGILRYKTKENLDNLLSAAIRLAEIDIKVQQKFLSAFGDIFQHDGAISLREYHSLHTFAEIVGLPLPSVASATTE